MNKYIIEIRDMYKIYTMGEYEVRALDGVDLLIEPNEFVSIIGPSGSGKSTLMNMIGCLDTPTSGTYLIESNDVSRLTDSQQAKIRNKHLGFIFQQYNLLPKLNVFENVELPLIYGGYSISERKKMVNDVIEQVGLSSHKHHKPSELSGGQQQRVSIARALAGRPSVLLADEPTGALDSKTGREVLDLLKELHRDGKTIVLITHDQTIANEAERIVKINDGKISSDTKAGDAF